MSQIHHITNLDVLKEAMNEPEMKVRLKAIGAISSYKPEIAFPILEPLLEDSDPEISRTTTMRLLKRKNELAYEKALKLLEDGIDDEKENIALTIASNGYDYGVDYIMDKIKNPKNAWMLTYLQKNESQKATMAFVEGLHSPFLFVRARSTYALGARRSKMAIPHLIETMKDEYPNVRRMAAQALFKITGVILPPESEKWRQWWDENKSKYENPEEAPSKVQ